MKINHFTIDENEIIGVSPVMIQTVKCDPSTEQIYAPRKIFFNVYTKSNTIEISSPTLSTKSLTESGEKYLNDEREIIHDAQEQLETFLTARIDEQNFLLNLNKKQQ